MAALPVAQTSLARTGFAGKNPADLVPANPLFTIKAGKLANGGNNPLPGTSGGSDRLDQGPAIVIVPTFFFVFGADTWPRLSPYSLSYRKGVFSTTSDFQRTQPEIIQLSENIRPNSPITQHHPAEDGLMPIDLDWIDLSQQKLYLATDVRSCHANRDRSCCC